MAKAEKRPTKKVAALAKVGDGAKKRAVALVALVRRRKARIVEDFFDMGVALFELQEKKLYAVLGYESMRALVEGEDLLAMTQASKLMAVARAYTRDEAIGLGLERAYQIIRYVEATPEIGSPRVVVETNAKIGEQPIALAPVRTLVAATREARERAHPKRVDPEAIAARRAARELEARLRKRGARRATARAVKRAGGFAIALEIAVEDASLVA